MRRRDFFRNGLLTTAALSTATATTGCATFMDVLCGLVKAPEMSLKSFKVKKMTLTSLQVDIVALITNPNPFGFSLAGLDWGVSLAGGQTATGRSPKGLTLKARGRSETELDLDFNIAKTAEAILELLEKKSVPIKVNAVGHLRANKYKFDVPGEFETKLAMPIIPRFDVPTFKVKRADLSGITFQVEPLVSNANNFDINIDTFDFDIKLDGRQVLKNKNARKIRLESKGHERVPFNFEVGLAEIGMTLAKLASNPRLDWELDANLRSGILNMPFKQAGRVTL
jgi:LEA14-like dessication related protein